MLEPDVVAHHLAVVRREAAVEATWAVFKIAVLTCRGAVRALDRAAPASASCRDAVQARGQTAGFAVFAR